MTIPGTNGGGVLDPLSMYPEGCKVAANALRVFTIPAAKSQLSSIIHKGRWTTFTSLGLLVVWCVFMVVRYRVLQRRVSKMVCDFVAVLLVAVATTLFFVGATTLSSGRNLPFWKEYVKFLGNSTINGAISFSDQVPRYFITSSTCLNIHGHKVAANLTTQRALDDIKERAQLILSAGFKPFPFPYIIASSFATIAALFLLISIIFFVIQYHSICQDIPGGSGSVFPDPRKDVRLDPQY